MESRKRIQLAGLSVEQYDAILNHCNSNIFVTDGRGQILYANAASERALNCSFELLRSMDVYQLNKNGYTSYSSTGAAIRTGKTAFAVYRNNLGEEIATTSIPVYGDDGRIEMVVTRSDEVEDILSQQKTMERYRAIYREVLDRISPPQEEPIANSPLMKNILERVKKYADNDASVLLTGESGTGKEVLANWIKENSPRRDQPFLTVNCAAIPNELIESEFFGYEPGAFTGARREGKPGIFELASGGTVFLDEVGDLSLLAQSKLLRVLESGEFMRVGGKHPQRADVRVIAATNRDLKALIRDKLFRPDVYYRLSVFPVTIPPLRSRKEDIEPLALHFLHLFERKYRVARALPPRLMEKFLAYPWPGNIRELRNTMENYTITGEEPLLLSMVPEMTDGGDTDTRTTLEEVLDRAESGHIAAVLRECSGDVTLAAGRLGIHRSVLYKKMGKYGLKRP